MMQRVQTRLATWRARARRALIPATVALVGMPLPALAGIGNMQSTSSSYGGFPTLYTAGDPVPIASALNSVAMLFGGGDSVDSIVAGGMACMALVALIAVIGQSVLHNRFMIGEYLVMLLVALCLFIPTTSIQVVSYFSDSGTAINAQPPQFVDNVPIGMAYAAGIAGLIDYTVTNKIETAFSSASAESNFMALGTDGFAKPLKLMLDMRDMFDCNTHQTTCQNMFYFIHYCKFGGANRSSTLDMTQLDNPATGAGIVGLLSSQPQGYTQYTPQTIGTPIAQAQLVPCSTAAQGLISTMNSYIGNAPVPELYSPNGVTLTQDLQVVTAQNDSSAETPNSTFNTSGSALDDYFAFIQGIATNNQISGNTFMINHIFSRPVLAAIQADAHPDAAATFSQIMGDAKERARVQMAGSGSMFTEFMTSSMNIMTFLFVALTPIVAILFLVAGMRAFSIVFTYLMFGIWTQSWMPCAAIISYYTQISYQNMISGSRVSGMMFAPSNIERLYDRTADMLASAGSMMAEAPLIMMAVMSGSMFALTSLANKANASGAQINPDVAAPNVAKATNSDAIISSYAANTGRAVAGQGIMGAVASGSALSDAQVQASPQLTTSGGFQEGVGASAAAQAGATQSVSAYASKMASIAAQFGQSNATALNAQIAQTSRLDNQISNAASDAIGNTDSTGQTAKDSTSTDGNFGVSGGFRIPNPFAKREASEGLGGENGSKGGKGSGDLLAIGGKYGGSTSQGLDKTGGSSQSVDHRETGQKGTSEADGNGTSVGRSGTESTNASWNEAVQEARQLASQAQHSLTKSQGLQHSLQSTEAGAAQNSIRMGALTQRAQVAGQDVQQQALTNAVHGAQGMLQQATSDPTKASQIMGQLTAGVDFSRYSPSNMTALMRNATNMLRSNDFAQQAVGYRVASVVSAATGLGDSQGLNRTASAYADGAKTLERAQSLTPGLSQDQAQRAAGLDATVQHQIDAAGGQLGTPNPNDQSALAPDLRDTTFSAVKGQFVGNQHAADGVVAAAQAQQASNIDQGHTLERQSVQGSIKAEQRMRDNPDNPLNTERKDPHQPHPRPPVNNIPGNPTATAQSIYTQPPHANASEPGSAAPVVNSQRTPTIDRA